MPISKFETTVLDSITNAMRANRAQGLLLGGIAGSGGGSGGPPGGFIGYLPQTKVAYDLSEIASSGTAVSGSIVDNLNHIRYRLEVVESGLVVEEGTVRGHIIKDNVTTFAQRANLKFLGGADILDDAGTDTTVITISGGAGAGGGHTIEDEGAELSARTYLDFVGRGVTVSDEVLNDKTVVTISGMPWFNVKEFGAIANGIVNDNAAVESGIAALNAAGGGVLYFPAGTYLVDGDFSDITANCVVMGDGGSINGQHLDTYLWEILGSASGLSVLQLVDNNSTAIFSTSADMAIFKDFAIIAEYSAPEADYAISAYSPTNVYQRINVYNCSFIGFSNAIYLVGGDSCEIIGNTVLGGGFGPAVFISDTTNFVIEDNRFICLETANEAIDLFWYSVDDIVCRGRVNSNYFYSSQDPNVVSYTSFCWDNAITLSTPMSGCFFDISNNHFDAIALYAIEIDVNDAQADSRITITDNTMVTNAGGGTGHAIYVGKTSGTNNPNMGLIISGNIFKSGGTPTQSAIQLEQIKQAVIIGNKNINFPTLLSATTCSDIRVEDLEHTSAASSPTTTNDASKGYNIGDIWVNTITSGAYVCVDDTVGAAVWNQLSLIGGLLDADTLEGHAASYFQTALGFTPEDVANKSNDTTLAGDSSTLYPTQHAVKEYVDNAAISGISLSGILSVGSVTDGHIAVFSGSSGDFVRDGGLSPWWTQTIDENGSSFTNFTGVAGGTWSSDGTVIKQTVTTAAARRAKYNIVVPTAAIVWEGEVNIQTAGATRRGGLIVGFNGSAGNGALVYLDEGGNTINLEADAASLKLSVAATINVNTWYKIRMFTSGGITSFYLDGVLMGSASALSSADCSYVGLYSYQAEVWWRNLKGWSFVLPA